MNNIKLHTDIIKALEKGHDVYIDSTKQIDAIYVSLDKFIYLKVPVDHFYIRLPMIGSEHLTDLFSRFEREALDHSQWLERYIYTGKTTEIAPDGKKRVLAQIGSDKGNVLYLDKKVLERYFDLSKVSFAVLDPMKPALICEGDDWDIKGGIMLFNINKK